MRYIDPQGQVITNLQTILNQVPSGSVVELEDGIYSLTSTLVIPDGVAVNGKSILGTILQWENATTNATLIQMGNTCRLEGLGLRLTSNEHHQLIGIQFPGNTIETSRVVDVQLLVSNTLAPTGSSEVYGIYVNGSGVTPFTRESIRDSIINVNSTSSGNKKGIYITGAAEMHIKNTQISCARTGSGGSYIGVQTNNAGVILRTRYCAIFGSDNDIAQSFGQLNIDFCYLANSTASTVSFGCITERTPLTFSCQGAIVAGVTRYLWPGIGPLNLYEMIVTIPSRCVVHSLAVKAQTGPGGARTDTFILRKNGVDTYATVALVGAATSATSPKTVTYQAGDTLSIKCTSAALSTTTNFMVSLGIY